MEWAVEIEKPAAESEDWAAEIQNAAATVSAAAESEQWGKHSIYLIPRCIKDLNPAAYTPQVVSFGPYHHGREPLSAMEDHKLRALLHLLRRSAKPLAAFSAAVRAEERRLMDAYDRLDEPWRAHPEAFLKMMILDGCFMLEVLRAATSPARPSSAAAAAKYAYNDPIFSRHGVTHAVPYIRRDMLMLENQLPLLLLRLIVSVENSKPKKPQQDDDYVNRLVLKFFGPNETYTSMPLGLHPLDLWRSSLLRQNPKPGEKPRQPADAADADPGMVLSAAELHEAGVRFRPSGGSSLRAVKFRGGVLTLPEVAVDDLTEPMFRNLMAMERLHPGAGSEVTGYVFFMDKIIDSAKDVALLQEKGIIQNALGSDKAVAKLFNSLSMDASLEAEGGLDEVHARVSAYCRRRWPRWRASLVHTYFRSPWPCLSLAAAVFLLVLTVAQTVFTVLQWSQGLSEGGSSPPAGSPSPN